MNTIFIKLVKNPSTQYNVEPFLFTSLILGDIVYIFFNVCIAVQFHQSSNLHYNFEIQIESMNGIKCYKSLACMYIVYWELNTV